MILNNPMKHGNMAAALAIIFLFFHVFLTGHVFAIDENNEAHIELFSVVDPVVDVAINGDLPAIPFGLPGDEEISVKRSARVTVNPIIQSTGMIARNDSLRFHLFNDKIHTGIVEKVISYVEGTVTVRAGIKDHPGGYILISSTAGQTLGSIRIPETDESYLIHYVAADDEHYLSDIEQYDIIDDCPLHIPEYLENDNSLQYDKMDHTLLSDPSEHVTIDVMIVYTPAARNWAGGSSSIANVISQAMGRADISLDNSDVYLSVDLVHSAEVDYEESGNSRVDLRRLTASPDYNPWGSSWGGYDIPGYMDEVHVWRDQYAADLVALFAVMSDFGGLAWLLSNTSGSPNYGFSMTRVQQAAHSYTYIHETAHNIGAHHHKEDSSPGPGIFDYSAGWKWNAGPGKKYATVMSYPTDGHTRIAYFSNPDVDHEDHPTGHTTDGDNARTLREMKHVVASYRGDPVEVYTLTLAEMPEEGGSVEIVEGAKDYYNYGDEVTITATPSGGFQFDNWNVNGEDGGNSSSIVLIIEGNTTVIGSFTEVTLAAPVLISPENNAAGVSVTPELNWEELSGAEGYTVQVSKNSDMASPIVNQSDITETSFELSGLENGTKYHWRVRGVNDVGESAWSDIWSFTTEHVIVSDNIILQQGWNLVSSNVAPEESAIEILFSGIIDDLFLVKDGDGKVYWPSQGVNSIETWDYRSGYQVYMNDEAVLDITGTSVVPSETAIELSGGWNMTAYFSNTALDPAVALESILNELLIAKDNDGGVYWPEYNTNTLGDMTPGKGYQLYLNNSSTLIYPDPEYITGDEKESPNGPMDELTHTPNRFVVPFKPTGNNATMLIQSSSFQDGDEVGVFTKEGKLAGSGVARSGNVLLTVWGQDNIASNGAGTDERLFLQAYSARTKLEQTLQIKTITDAVNGVKRKDELRYAENSIYIIVAEGYQDDDLPATFTLTQNYPNPFNPSTQIRFSIPGESHVRLAVYSLIGQEVAVLIDETRRAGTYTVDFNATGLSSGVYFYRLDAGYYHETRRMVLTR